MSSSSESDVESELDEEVLTPLQLAEPLTKQIPVSSMEGQWGLLSILVDAEISAAKPGRGEILLFRPCDSEHILGRDSDEFQCRVNFTDVRSRVSGHHCKIVRRLSEIINEEEERKCEVFVEDTSLNGTWVNGERLNRNVPTKLNHGDVLTLPGPPKGAEGYRSGRITHSFLFREVSSPAKTVQEGEAQKSLKRCLPDESEAECSKRQEIIQNLVQEHQTLLANVSGLVEKLSEKQAEIDGLKYELTACKREMEREKRDNEALKMQLQEKLSSEAESEPAGETQGESEDRKLS